MRILLVDDDESIRQLIELTLRFTSSEVEVMHADHGEQALAICERSRPDAIVVDGHLPGLSGDALGEALRELVPAAKIVSFTGTAGEPEWADIQVVKASDDALDKVIAAITDLPV